MSRGLGQLVNFPESFPQGNPAQLTHPAWRLRSLGSSVSLQIAGFQSPQGRICLEGVFRQGEKEKTYKKRWKHLQ